ncbi:hypothetical protein [Niallia sp. NCCP-28]|uniref:hypothetical protein n=1 Tax=Niallia sp. NCCP-28 TaxID=2934712 RepID=UPI00207DBCC1|nr:hypothetical protein [Niallia sp. NCCP-28]GKU81214.1 hypothetical protein NCCP28_06100 [Niallia sp. NCCP-28]
MFEENYKGFDTSIVYDYREYPDKNAGICDNCGNAQFKSSIKNTIFLRECRKCGMKKSI